MTEYDSADRPEKVTLSRKTSYGTFCFPEDDRKDIDVSLDIPLIAAGTLDHARFFTDLHYPGDYETGVLPMLCQPRDCRIPAVRGAHPRMLFPGDIVQLHIDYVFGQPQEEVRLQVLDLR